MIPIPSEQLYHPVRVCDDCFAGLVRTKKSLIISEDTNVEQIVAVDNVNSKEEDSATKTNQEAF